MPSAAALPDAQRAELEAQVALGEGAPAEGRVAASASWMPSAADFRKGSRTRSGGARICA